MEHVVVGICGASGAILGLRIAKLLAERKCKVHLVITDAARMVLHDEVLKTKADDNQIFSWFPKNCRRQLVFHAIDDIGACIASGSFTTQGMIIAPCSMATLAAVSLGLSDNILRRAADVCLKERRNLVILPREMPFSLLHLEHMCALTKLGAVIMPPQPTWYTHPATLCDVEEHIAMRAVATLGIQTNLPRWKGRSV